MNYRSPEELVAQLDQVAEVAVGCSLAVHCGDHSELLPAGEPDNINRLTELMSAGNYPLAIVTMHRQGSRLVVAALALVEVEKMPGIDGYLDELVRHHQKILIEDGVGTAPKPN